MYDELSISAQLAVPLGTQIVLRAETLTHLPGSVGEIVACPDDHHKSYRVRFTDSSEMSVSRADFFILKQVKKGPFANPSTLHASNDLSRFIIYRCVVGSQAYGLSHNHSDFDRRGIYLPPADMHWSLYGVPEQLENKDTEECYWELQKFLSLALRANPNILECLYTPLVEHTTEISSAILAKRDIFLSKIVFQTYNGYVMSQFKKLEQDLRSTGNIKWKHVMHLVRLLLQGISVLQQAQVPVLIAEYRDDLLAIRDGSRAWSDVNKWRLDLHRQFDAAFQTTRLPDAPDYAEADRLLIWARRAMLETTA